MWSVISSRSSLANRIERRSRAYRGTRRSRNAWPPHNVMFDAWSQLMLHRWVSVNGPFTPALPPRISSSVAVRTRQQTSFAHRGPGDSQRDGCQRLTWMCVANELGRANALSQYPHISFLASPCSWAPCLTRLRVGPLGRSFLVGAVACQAVPARAYQRGGSGGGMLITLQGNRRIKNWPPAPAPFARPAPAWPLSCLCAAGGAGRVAPRHLPE